MAKIGATGGNTDGAMGSFTAPRVGGFSGNKKQPTTDRFQNNFFSSVRREDQVRSKEEGPANKIVKFGAGVKAKDPGNGSLIKSISTNINNQFGDAITQLQSNVTNIVSPVLDRLKAEHRRSIDDAESNKPTNLLGGFLDMLRSGLDFIRFLSDRKRLAFLRQGIKNLKTGFNELFIVGETVAKTLKKLIKQIQKLGQEGGKGGGFRLPGMPRFGGFGGGNRRQRRSNQRPAGTPRRNMFRGKGRGLAAAGGLALTGGALMGLMPQESQTQGQTEVEAEENVVQTGQLISKETLEKFDQVLDAFNKAIGILSKPDSPDTGSTSAPAGSPTSPSTQPMSAAMGGKVSTAGVETNEAKAAIQTIRELEGTAGDKGYSRWFGDAQGEAKYGDITTKTLKEVDDLQTKFLKDPQSEFTDMTGKKDRSAAVGAGQFTFLLRHARRMDPNVDITKQTFSEEYQNKLMMFLAAEKGVDLNKGLTEADMKKLGGVWASLTPQYNQTSRTASQSLRVYHENLRKMGESPVVPAGEQAKVMKKVSQQVAQPARKGGGVSVVPVGGGSQRVASGGGGRGPANKREQGGIPFMSSSMNENAHDMFSRMTYNVVG